MASLFGPTPQELIAAQIKEQEQMDLLRNQQFAQQGSQFGVFAPLYQAGLKLGDVGARSITQSMFPENAIQNPQLQKATAIQSVLQKYSSEDQTNPEVLTKIGRELMSVAPDAAINALTLAEKFKKDKKLTTVAPGATVINEAGEVVFTAPDKAASAVKPSESVVRAAGALGFKIPNDVTQFTREQWVAIDDKINQQKREQAAASAAQVNARLNFEDPKGQVAAISEVNTNLKPFRDQITALDQALTLRRNDKSPFSQKLFEQTVAGAFGDSQKAAAEITRLVNTGNLGQRVTNTLGLFLSGNIGNATKEDQLESLSAIRDYVAKQYDDTASTYRSVLGDKADKIAPTAAQRFTRPKLPPNQQYIPMSIVNQYGLTKGKRGKKGNQEFVYNGDGTITILKGN